VSAAAVKKRVKVAEAAEASSPDGALVDLLIERAEAYVIQSKTSADRWLNGIAFGFYYSAHIAAGAPREWPLFSAWARAFLLACAGGDGTDTDWTKGGHA
jgi:hypothetical protein